MDLSSGSTTSSHSFQLPPTDFMTIPCFGAFDVMESACQYTVYFDVPGVKANDISLTISKSRLMTLKVQRVTLPTDDCSGTSPQSSVTGSSSTQQSPYREESPELTWSGNRFERFHGKCTRSMVVPVDADLVHIDADLDDGVLKVTIPRKKQ